MLYLQIIPDFRQLHYSFVVLSDAAYIKNAYILTGVKDARYKDEYNISVTFGCVPAMSISILESFSSHNALACASISSKVELPISDSALAQACSSERNDTPTRMLTVLGLSA